MAPSRLRSATVALVLVFPGLIATAAAWTFTDVTETAGVACEHGWIDPSIGGASVRPALVNTSGVAAGDYDGDALPDLYVVAGDIGTNKLFRNRGDGTFEEVAAPAGVALTGHRSAGPTFADVDGDGWLDLLVLGIGEADGNLAPTILYRNRGDGTFQDVSATSGLNFDRDSVSASFGDYDRDGDLDLFVTHWGDNRPPGSSQHLWRNDGNFRFTDVSAASGIQATYTIPGTNQIGDLSFTANFADIDNDGWLDLLVAGDFRTSQIFRNDGNGTFSNVTTGAISDENAMGAAVGDYDADGNLDWFVSSIWDPDQNAMGNNWLVSGNRLYRGRGDGTFEDRTEQAGVREGYWGWGATFADLDNDGHLDIYHTNGWNRLDPAAAEFHFDPARLFVSDRDGTFTERSAEVGLDDTLPGRGVVAFDYDRDGDLDLFIASNQGPARLYRNDGGNDGNWIAVRLRGRAPNARAIGARVQVTVNGRTQIREVRAGSNFVSQNPAEVHVGLGAAESAAVEIRWPDGAHSSVGRVATNQRLVVDQPPPGVDEQTPGQKRCIVALNKAGATLAGAVARRFTGCIERGVMGTESATACLVGDPQGRVANAAAKLALQGARRCEITPTFGPASAAVVGDALGAVVRVGDLFGPDLDAALIDAATDPAGAACQTEVARGLTRIATARLKAFNACKTTGLRRNTIRSVADLGTCHTAADEGKVPATIVSAQRRIEARCATTAIPAALPGACAGASAETLATCLATQARCGTCLALRTADRLGVPCHVFIDGVATSYCGDAPTTIQTVARQWNEELLDAIRRDTPRPTVHARNLFHLSAVMWDAWTAYGGGGQAWLTSETHASEDVARDRATAISFAAYRLLAHRFTGGPGAAASQASFRARMYALGYDVAFTSTVGDAPAAVGNRIAAAMITFGAADGANEAGNYADPGYAPVNAPLVVKQPGTTMVDPNRWQPLALDLIVTQNGIPLPDKLQSFIGARWNGVAPFALVRDDPDDVYIDPGPPPQLGGAGDAGYKDGARRVLELASWLTPNDGVVIDVSPASLGNNTLGTNDGTGYPVNPVTGAPYTPQPVPRGDWARILAEFWADGPSSETPPGHWNVLANEVSDHPSTVHRLGGAGPVLDRLEWDVKLYLALNGAVHDAAIAAWGLKRRYDSVRPISMIRYMGGLGQSSDPLAPSYHPDGLPLMPGVIEVIMPATTAPGERHDALAGHEGEMAVLSWPGQPADPVNDVAGVRWLRAVEWVPYQKNTFVTPAFAGFTSGHSTFSRAAAEVMTRFTGSAFFPDGLGEFVAPANAYLTFERGPNVEVRLQWARYYDAADQAGLSRLLGGIHVPADDF